MKKIIEEVILEENIRSYGRQNSGEKIETAIEMTVITEARTGLKKGHFLKIMAITELEVQAIVDPGLDP